MRRTVVFGALMALLMVTTALAQIPRTFSFQGFLADAGGNPVADGPHTVFVRLYDAGGNLLYSETHSTSTIGGVFGVLIGSVTPIPTSIDFADQYFVGLSIDGGTELNPRTGLTSVPYALRAAQAETIAPEAGVVSLNGGTGDLTLEGGGGTTVNRSGNTITISSSGGSGTGIAGVQSPDGSLAITNPNGPVAAITIADNGVTLPKINAAGAATGDVLTYNGSTLEWSAPTAGLTLPFNGSSASGSDLFTITGSGVGAAGIFTNTNSSPNRSALIGVSSISSAATTLGGVEGRSATGMGVIGRGGAASTAIFGVIDTGAGGSSFFAGSGVMGFSDVGAGVGGMTYANGGYGVRGSAIGSGIGVYGASSAGVAGRFVNSTAGNTSNALEAQTNGSGAAIDGLNSATAGTTIGVRGQAASTARGSGAAAGVSGVLGLVTPTAPGAYSAGVRGISNGTAANGIGVVGYHAGSGWGVYGETPSGTGVYGVSGTGVGVRGETFGTGGVAIEARYSGSGLGTALEIENGAIKLTGTNKAAFVHTATVANKISVNGTDIDNAMCNGDPNAILIVTQKLNPAAFVYNNSPIGVYYNSARSKWEIFNQNSAAIPTNAQFNVLVIKQ